MAVDLVPRCASDSRAARPPSRRSTTPRPARPRADPRCSSSRPRAAVIVVIVAVRFVARRRARCRRRRPVRPEPPPRAAGARRRVAAASRGRPAVFPTDAADAHARASSASRPSPRCAAPSCASPPRTTRRAEHAGARPGRRDSRRRAGDRSGRVRARPPGVGRPHRSRASARRRAARRDLGAAARHRRRRVVHVRLHDGARSPAVVPDSLVGAAEVVVPDDSPLAITTPRFLLVAYRGDRSELEAAIAQRAAAPGAVPCAGRDAVPPPRRRGPAPGAGEGPLRRVLVSRRRARRRSTVDPAVGRAQHRDDRRPRCRASCVATASWPPALRRASWRGSEERRARGRLRSAGRRHRASGCRATRWGIGITLHAVGRARGTDDREPRERRFPLGRAVAEPQPRLLRMGGDQRSVAPFKRPRARPRWSRAPRARSPGRSPPPRCT